MAGIQFHETIMGHRFFEHQLPQLIKALNRCADAMEKANQISEAKDAEAKEKAEKAAEAAAIANSIEPIISAVNDALVAYSPEYVDVVKGAYGLLEVIWHSKQASFLIKQTTVTADDVDLNALVKALDSLGVGHCF